MERLQPCTPDSSRFPSRSSCAAGRLTGAAPLTTKDRRRSATPLVLNDLASAPTRASRRVPRKADCILIFRRQGLPSSVARADSVASAASGRKRALWLLHRRRREHRRSDRRRAADLVMLVMNQRIDHLLADKFTFGGEATATAGPVGRTVAATGADACRSSLGRAHRPLRTPPSTDRS
jgi:hypothetical protein